jgi:hypothetical protein
VCETWLADCALSIATRALPDAPLGAALAHEAANGISSCSSAFLGVSWSSGSVTDNVANDQYLVEWDTTPAFNSNGGAAFGSAVVAETGSEIVYTVQPLTAGLTYYVRVTPHNSLGWGAASATHSAVPMRKADAPTAVMLRRRTATEVAADASLLGTSIVVSWGLPSNLGGAVAQGAIVEWSSTPFSEFQQAVQTVTTSVASGSLGGSLRLTMDTRTCANCRVQESSQYGAYRL